MESTIWPALSSAPSTRQKLITGSKIQVGDVLIGFPSTGLHTNGYSLARKLFFEVAGYAPNQYVNDLKDKAGAALMKVHRSYLAVIKKLTAADLVVGMAHITGGGITENLPRILPKTISAVVETASWTPPPIFTHLQQLGSVEQEEMLRTFNMGIGLIAVVPADKFRRAKSMLDRAGEKFCVIGRTVKGDRKVSVHMHLGRRGQRGSTAWDPAFWPGIKLSRYRRGNRPRPLGSNADHRGGDLESPRCARDRGRPQRWDSRPK